MKFFKTACLSITLGLLASNFYAQEKADGPFKLAIKTQSSYIDKGTECTDNVTFFGDLKFSTKDNLFSIGVSSATSIVKDYNEFDYFVSFSKSGFSLSVWDVLSSSEGNKKETSKNAFNYNPKQTSHHIDVTLEYQFEEYLPLKLRWTTVVFGRDKGTVDTKKSTKGNIYSTYVSAYYPIVQGEKVNLTAGVGGAFALRKYSKTEDNFLYGNTAGIVNIELIASRDIEIFDYKLPVYISGVWNPQSEKTYMQIGVNLVKF